LRINQIYYFTAIQALARLIRKRYRHQQEKAIKVIIPKKKLTTTMLEQMMQQFFNKT
jgi:hypothetical protein